MLNAIKPADNKDMNSPLASMVTPVDSNRTQDHSRALPHPNFLDVGGL